MSDTVPGDPLVDACRSTDDLQQALASLVAWPSNLGRRAVRDRVREILDELDRRDAS